MLNPSTADANVDDPTIRRVIGFTAGLGFGGLMVVNLFALRATDPAELARHPDPVGPHNDTYIRAAAAEHGTVMLAWGAHPSAQRREAAVLSILRDSGARLLCLGTTKSGAPRHPLYLPASAPAVPYGGE
jgi:hypothetical protein